MPVASKSILVANPTARTGKAAPTIERAQAKLDEFGLQAEFFPTLPDGGTVAALAERIEALAANPELRESTLGTLSGWAAHVRDEALADET